MIMVRFLFCCAMGGFKKVGQMKQVKKKAGPFGPAFCRFLFFQREIG